MKEEKQISFALWPRNEAPAADAPRKIPYLDLSGEDEPIDFLFTLGGKYGLIARANLHTLQGTKKAGKSAAGLALMVAALKGSFLDITPSRGDLEILWIDTEQDRNTLRQKGRAVLEMAGLETMPDRLKIVTLRGYGSPADLLAATLQAIADNTADFVFLDGVVDLCPAFNDEEKSRDVVRQLEAYAEQYRAAILGLIHTNKRDNEARGHLGAVLQQKSAEIYQVNKDGDTATITQPFSRFAPVPSLSFDFSDDFKIKPAGGADNTTQWSYCYKQFEPLFRDVEQRQSKNLVEVFKGYYGKRERAAWDAIKAAVDSKVLVKKAEGAAVFYKLAFALEPQEPESCRGPEQEQEDEALFRQGAE